MNVARFALIPALALAAAGCGERAIAPSNIPAQPVKGTITYNGQPLTYGLLNLVLMTNTDKYGHAEAVAEIKPDGTFEPQQVGDQKGLVPGKWKAVVNPTYVKDGKSQKLAVPPKYTKEGTSDLTFEVREGDNTPTLALK